MQAQAAAAEQKAAQAAGNAREIQAANEKAQKAELARLRADAAAPVIAPVAKVHHHRDADGHNNLEGAVKLTRLMSDADHGWYDLPCCVLRAACCLLLPARCLLRGARCVVRATCRLLRASCALRLAARSSSNRQPAKSQQRVLSSGRLAT